MSGDRWPAGGVAMDAGCPRDIGRAVYVCVYACMLEYENLKRLEDVREKNGVNGKLEICDQISGNDQMVRVSGVPGKTALG